MHCIFTKKLVTRLPNFPDRRIRYEFYFQKNWHKRKNKFYSFQEQFQNIRDNFSPAKFALFCTYQKKGKLTPTPECDLNQNYPTNFWGRGWFKGKFFLTKLNFRQLPKTLLLKSFLQFETPKSFVLALNPLPESTQKFNSINALYIEGTTPNLSQK